MRTNASVPRKLLSQGTPVKRPAVTDVALAVGGRLEGRVINASGKPITQTAVTVQYQGNEVAQAVTDEGGRYAVRGLRGGVHQVVAGGESAAYRLWTDKAAPPAAKQDAVLVSYGAAPATSWWADCHAWLRNPWVIGATM